MKKRIERDDSDAGIEGDMIQESWTLDEVRQRALDLDKKFEPNRKIADRLTEDLAQNGVVVLFTPDEVKYAVSMGAIPKEYESDLMNLVNPKGLNDIAFIPAVSVDIMQRNKLIGWFLSNNRC